MKDGLMRKLLEIKNTKIKKGYYCYYGSFIIKIFIARNLAKKSGKEVNNYFNNYSFKNILILLILKN